ncbi:hypothetical protein AB205_0168250, partial [Aquarana catesbeiana]
MLSVLHTTRYPPPSHQRTDCNSMTPFYTLLERSSRITSLTSSLTALRLFPFRSPCRALRGGHNVRNTSEEHLIVSPDYNAEDNNIVQYSPGGNPVTPNIHPRPSQLGRSMDPSNPEESSDGSHTKTIGSHSTDTSIDPSIPKESSSSHEGVPTEESSLVREMFQSQTITCCTPENSHTLANFFMFMVCWGRGNNIIFSGTFWFGAPGIEF